MILAPLSIHNIHMILNSHIGGPFNLLQLLCSFFVIVVVFWRGFVFRMEDKVSILQHKLEQQLLSIKGKKIHGKQAARL